MSTNLKNMSNPFRSGLFKTPTLLLGLSALAMVPCAATAVDTELVLLVDAQTYSQSDFTLILESIASTFEQQAFQDAVLGGSTGKLAASVMLFNSPGEQVALNWTELTSTLQLQNFANSVRSISYPNAGGNVSYASALTSAAAQLDNNSFTGSNRQITLIDDGTGFYAAGPSATQAARNAALATSADVINAIVFDAQYSEAAVTSYYNANIVSPGGTLAVVSTPQGGPKNTAQINAVIAAVAGTVGSPTATATAAIPEPSALSLLGLGSLLILRRRR